MKIVAVEPIGMTSEQVTFYENKFAEKGHEFVCFPDRNENPEILAQRMKDANIVIISNIRLGKEVMAQCTDLKMLSVAFTGLDHIDLEYCRERGIEVVNAAGYATEAVAELAIGLVLDVYRKITELDSTTRNGGTRNNYLGKQISGKCVGIVGTGAIGARTAQLFQQFGCKVIAWSRTKKDDVINAGIEYVTLEKLMEESDIISLHVPMCAETKNLISREKLALCKPSAVIINTARGGVIDNAALAEMLADGRIAGAGIDVFETEPPLPKTHPLLTAPNCVLAPHVGYATREAFDIRIGIVMENIFKYISITN
ncbi:MAG: hydroxyacid dehydrogenase [Bacteroidales bacterium]|nr:hydroxyacid dehydrogenase [Bacteroidales bacterium]